MALRQIEWAAWYGASDSRVAHLEHAYSPARFLETLAAYLPRHHDARVLELGCAPGRWLAWVGSRLGLRPIGVELDRAGVTLTHALYPDIQLTRADAFAVPFANASFDAVYSIGLIEHFEDPTGILAESRRLLKPGGVSLWLIPNLAAGSFHRWHWRTFHRAKFEAHRPYSLEELEALITRGGFEVVHREYSGLYLPHLQRVLGRLPGRRLLRRWESNRWATNLVVVGRTGAIR